jgi:hypothetical protein
MPDNQTDESMSKLQILEIALACTPDLAAQIMTHWRSMGARPIGTAADLLGVEQGPARQAILDRISVVHRWSMSSTGESWVQIPLCCTVPYSCVAVEPTSGRAL